MQGPGKDGVSSPQASERFTEAAAANVPCRSVTAPAAFASPHGVDQEARSGMSAPATIIPPSSSPGIAAATTPPGSLARVRRRIRPTPTAITARGHSDRARVTASVSMVPAWARRTTPPVARRNTPV